MTQKALVFVLVSLPFVVTACGGGEDGLADGTAVVTVTGAETTSFTGDAYHSLSGTNLGFSFVTGTDRAGMMYTLQGDETLIPEGSYGVTDAVGGSPDGTAVQVSYDGDEVYLGQSGTVTITHSSDGLVRGVIDATLEDVSGGSGDTVDIVIEFSATPAG